MTHRAPIGTTDLAALGALATYCEHGMYTETCVDGAPQVQEVLTGTVTVSGTYAADGATPDANDVHYTLDVPKTPGKRISMHLEGHVQVFDDGACF